MPPVVWVAAVLLASFVLGEFYLGLAATVGINALLALGLILVTGYAGQFSLAQAAFYGIGAYGSALLTVKLGWPGLLALAASAAVAAVLAYALGKPIFRLRGHFLAMGTLALTEIFFLLVNNLKVTGGSSGFGGIGYLNVFGFEFQTLRSQFWLTWLVVGAVLWGSLRIGRSREGRALRAVRGHEAAAAACGVDVTWAKTRVFAGSAVVGSVAGSLYAHQLLYVNPPPFGVLTAIDILAIAVLGGLNSPWGAVIGAVGIEALRQLIEQFLPGLFGAGSVGAGEAFVLGCVLVIILVVRPDGLAGLFSSLTRRITARRGAGEQARAPEAGAHPDTPPSAATSAEHTGPGDRVVLQARGLSKRFGGVKAVDAVDLDLREHEILAVIGPNGAGKSTLLNLLSGNLPPTAGRVYLDGQEVTGAPAHVVAGKGLARTFQTPSLFAGMDARANVLVGAHLRGKVGLLRSAVPTLGAVREERRLGQEVDAVLAELGLTHLATQEATQLSLGQQKMLELARALAQRPRVLLLDEPGAGLNRAEKLALAQVLRRLRARGMSLLLIEHDMEFVMSLADRVHVLDFGRTLTVGTPAEVQSDQAVIDAYLGVPHDGVVKHEREAADANS